MTTYGTIPSSSSPAAAAAGKLQYISRAREAVTAGLGTRRPWREMFELRCFSLPNSIAEAVSRVQRNGGYFRMNYAIVVLAILFLGLLWHPLSLVAFVAMMAAWLFLYFLRDQPLVVFGRAITDGTVLMVLTVATVVVLLLTGAIANIVSALSVGVVAVLIHGAVRKTDDLVADEEAGKGLWWSAGGGASASS